MLLMTGSILDSLTSLPPVRAVGQASLERVVITVFHLFYDSLFELVEPEQSVLRRLVLYSLVLSPFRVRMGKRSARKSRKCPGCLLPDSDCEGFGFVPGL